MFDNDQHQDSHEYLSWILDQLHEKFISNEKFKQEKSNTASSEPITDSFVTDLFRGDILNTFTCITCETTTKKKEFSFNLSLDIEKNCSLRYCIERFAFKELLNKTDKFYCENCNTKQVATKEMKIVKTPQILLVHLKRFKINTTTWQHEKLSYRIPFPEELKLDQ